MFDWSRSWMCPPALLTRKLARKVIPGCVLCAERSELDRVGEGAGQFWVGQEGEIVPEVTVGMDDPEPGRLNPFLLPLHGLLAAKHPQGEFVDPRLEHGPELPLHETGLAQPLLLIWGDLIAPSTSFHFDGGRGASPGGLLLGLRGGCRWRGCWQSLLRLPTARGALVLSGGGWLPFAADQPLLLSRIVEVPAGQRGQAPFEAAAVPVGAGLGAFAACLRLQKAGVSPSAGVSPECPGAPSRGRRQWLEPDAFPPGVLVAVFLLIHDRRLGSYLLGQAVEPLAHGGGQLVHGRCCCCCCCSVRGRDPPTVPKEGNRHCPQAPAPSSRGRRDQRLACHLLTRLWHPQAPHQRMGSASRTEGKKKEGRQKSPPSPPLSRFGYLLLASPWWVLLQSLSAQIQSTGQEV